MTETAKATVSDSGEKKEKFVDRLIDWTYKIVSIAMIPLVIWIFSVERRLGDTKAGNLVQQEKNRQYREKLDELKKISDDLKVLVTGNNTALVKFNGEFKLVNSNIGHLKTNIQRLEKLTGELNALLKSK